MKISWLAVFHTFFLYTQMSSQTQNGKLHELSSSGKPVLGQTQNDRLSTISSSGPPPFLGRTVLHFPLLSAKKRQTGAPHTSLTPLQRLIQMHDKRLHAQLGALQNRQSEHAASIRAELDKIRHLPAMRANRRTQLRAAARVTELSKAFREAKGAADTLFRRYTRNRRLTDLAARRPELRGYVYEHMQRLNQQHPDPLDPHGALVSSRMRGIEQGVQMERKASALRAVAPPTKLQYYNGRREWLNGADAVNSHAAGRLNGLVR